MEQSTQQKTLIAPRSPSSTRPILNLKARNQHKILRKKYIGQALDVRLIETFTQLFKLGRYDQNKFQSLEDLLIFANQIGQSAQRTYQAIEKLLESEGITSEQIDPKESWTFALYQILRQLEYKEYDKAHIYTSLVGKNYANVI